MHGANMKVGAKYYVITHAHLSYDNLVMWQHAATSPNYYKKIN